MSAPGALRGLAERWLESIGPRDCARAEAIGDWARRLELVDARRGLAATTPLLCVVLGPTGAGKSTLFNAVLGRPLSPPGVVRPATRHPVAAGSPEALSALRGDVVLAEPGLAIEWVALEAPPPAVAARVLVDTPDFDSIEHANRRRAETLLRRADRLLLVLTPEKYGDRSIWELVDRHLALGSFAGAVLNKAEGAGPLSDVAALLARRGLPAPLVVARRRGTEDPASFDAQTRAALAALFAGSDVPAAVHDARLAAALAWEKRARDEVATPFAAELDRARAALRRGVADLRAGLPDRIRRDLALELDGAVRRELEGRFLEEVRRIDVLREPRRWMLAPFTAVRAWLGGRGDERAAVRRTSLWLTDLFEQRFERFSLDLHERVRALVDAAEQSAARAHPWPRFESPSRDEVRAHLARAFERLETEVARESDRIAEGLPMQARVGFYGSQVFFHALTLLAFVKTGGLLSLGEITTQGLLSPFLASLLGRFVSSSEAEKVEQRLAECFAESMREALAPPLDTLEAAIDASERALPGEAMLRALARAFDAGNAGRRVAPGER